MTFHLGHRSELTLEGVHPDLERVVRRAIQITHCDFAVIEGVRAPSRQRLLFDAGATKTLNSRHLTGHAVDLAAYVDGHLRWDWPLYYQISDAMKLAAAELKVPIEWGGDWTTFKDGPHFQLPWAEYPT